MNKLPIDVHGKVLQPYEHVEDINVGDNEVLIMEWRVSFDLESNDDWAFELKS